MPGLDNNLGLVDLKDGDTLPIAQTHVRVKGQSFDLGKLVAARERDGFDEELKTFAVKGNAGRMKAGGAARCS